MPIYEFKCYTCNLKFERIYSTMKENATENCPSCNKIVGKIMSASSFRFSDKGYIPKEIDMKVGADADKRWESYHEKRKEVVKLREEHGIHNVARTPDGNYVPEDGSEKNIIREDIVKNYKNSKIIEEKI